MRMCVGILVTSLTDGSSSISTAGLVAAECVKESRRGVKEVEADPGCNLHHPLLQALPLASLTDDNFIISDGKSSLLP